MGKCLVMAKQTSRRRTSSNQGLVRVSLPTAAIQLPAAFFLSVLSPETREPNALIYLAYVGEVVLAVGLLVLGMGPIRRRRRAVQPTWGLASRSKLALTQTSW